MTRRLSLTLVGPALLCAFLAPQRSRANDPDERAIGFDHVWHEGQVSVAGQSPIECARCHAVSPSGQLTGRPDHKSCYGDCHGPAPAPRVPGRPYTFKEENGRQCRTCHTPRALAEAVAGGRSALTVAYPPYHRDPDHGVRMSHATHDEPARRRVEDCAVCHPQVGNPRATLRDPHARCAECHGRAIDALAGDPAGTPTAAERMAPMTECRVCHEQVIGPRPNPSIIRGTYPVTQTFSHGRHNARSPLFCRQCHPAIASATGSELSPPTMASCASCHDGEQAFATTGTSCRRCHTARSTRLRMRKTRLARFSHRDHKVERADCRDCHELDEKAEPQATSADHQPCANKGCHREQFSALQPTICTTCHLGTEPWRPLHFDRPPPASTEFGARFSHRRHMTTIGMQRACGDCHGRAEDGHLRLPRNHDACSGSGCHERAGGPTPSIDRCRDCHKAGVLRGRERKRRATRWNVRARFRHDLHERDPRTGKDAACTDCHQDVASADTIDAIPTPTKSTCQDCHDGQIAFKVTGHGCARCHGDTSQ